METVKEVNAEANKDEAFLRESANPELKNNNLINLEHFNDDFALVSLHVATKEQLMEILEFIKEKKFITARIYYKDEEN